jgi:hypothetical protein
MERPVEETRVRNTYRNGRKREDSYLYKAIDKLNAYHAITYKEFAFEMGYCIRHAKETLLRLKHMGVVYVKFKNGRSPCYALRTEDEI